jgi:hypothetical protein
MWSKINSEGLKGQYQIGMAFKNGPRGWTMDEIHIPAGPVVDFDGLKSRWWGKGALPPEAAHMKPGELAYKSIQSHRKSSMTFHKGNPVFILDDPEGTPWVMQAYSMFVDTSVNYDTLKVACACQRCHVVDPESRCDCCWKFEPHVLQAVAVHRVTEHFLTR